jgi:hypothetical protein
LSVEWHFFAGKKIQGLNLLYFIDVFGVEINIPDRIVDTASPFPNRKLRK